MKKKIIGIMVVTLLIATASLVVGTMNKVNDKTISSTQLSGVEWSKTYGGDEFDMFHCVQQTQEGGFIVSGAHEISNKYYPLLLKLDSVGDEEWRWTISQISFEGTRYEIDDVYPIFCNQVSDGGYLFCLWIDLTIEGTLHTIAGLFKYNENGQQAWSAFYPEDFDWGFRPISFIEVEDGYVAVGTSGASTSFMGDVATLLKIDTSGNELWCKEYDYGDSDDRMEAVCQTSDGGYILTGWGKDTSYDYWMIKTDESGNEQWNRTYGGPGDDYDHTKACYQTRDDGYLLCGFSSSFGEGGSDVWIVKTDSSGNMIWNKTYGGTKNDVCWDIESTDNEGFVFVATMNYGGFSGDKDDINIVKIDNDGNIVWVQTYAGPDVQMGTSLDKTHDGGFIVSGCTGSFHSSRSDGLLVKFAAFENQRPDKPTKPSGSERGKTGNEYTYSTSTSDSDGNQVYYLWDWGDGNFSEWLGPFDSGIDCEASYIWEAEGDYSIRVMAKDVNGAESDWSDPLPVSMPKSKGLSKNPTNGSFEAEIGRKGNEDPLVVLDGNCKVKGKFIVFDGTATAAGKKVGKFKGAFKGNHFIIKIPVKGKVLTILGQCSFDKQHQAFSGKWIGPGKPILGWIKGTLTPSN